MLQAHELVPAPVLVHVALVSQPPFDVAQLLIAVHVVPLPEYPVLHAQVTVPPVPDVHFAVVAQPPLFVAHPLIPVHVVPLPV